MRDRRIEDRPLLPGGSASGRPRLADPVLVQQSATGTDRSTARITPNNLLAAQRRVGNRAVAGLIASRPTAQRAPTTPLSASPRTLVHEGLVVTVDDATNRATCEQQIVIKGWPSTRGWMTRFINMDATQEMKFGAFGQGVEPDTIKAMRASVDRVYNALSGEREKFLKDFEARSVTTANEVLNASEKQIKDQLRELGVTANTFLGFNTGGYDMDAGKSAGLRVAARELAAKKREADAAARVYLRAKSEADAVFNKSSAPALAEALSEVFLSPELKSRLDATRATGLKLAHEYDDLCAEKQKTNPILTTFTGGSDAVARLEDLANRGVGDMATKVATVANEKLENIATVRGALGGRFSVWKEPHLRELTKKDMTVQSWQSRVAEEHAAEVVAKERDTEMMVAAIAIGLGLVAAIPTAGASLGVATAVAAAAVGGMVLSVYGAYEHYQDYSLASAAQNSAFDRAQAIAQDEPPELFWLAVDIATAIVDMKAAATALKTVGTLLREARAAKSAEKLAELVDGAKKAGLSAETTGKLTAAAMGGGNDTQIVKSLEQLKAVFKQATKTTVGDAELAVAFHKAAEKAIADNKVALYAGTTAERRTVVVTQLQRHGFSGAALEQQADRLMAYIEKKGTMGLYDSVTDCIFVRSDRSPASAAATLAHELAHQRQELVVGLTRLRVLEREFTAFHAQKQFLISLDLPAERWPKSYRWLATADNEAIKAHIVAEYAVDPATKLHSFSTFDEAGEWILTQLKKRP